MSKLNPYDLPPEEKNRHVRIVIGNIVWDCHNPESYPKHMSIPIRVRRPDEPVLSTQNVVTLAMDKASAAVGVGILDCDILPVTDLTDIDEGWLSAQAASAKLQEALRKKHGEDYSVEDNLDDLLAKSAKIAESEENGIYSDAFLETLKAGEDPNDPLNQWEKDEGVSDSTLEYVGDIYTNDT